MFPFLEGPRVYWIYTHKNQKNRFRNGLKANTEISYWIGKALQEAFPRVTILRQKDERPYRLACIRSKDVVIGHFGETWWKASQKTKKMITFAPWSGDPDRSQSDKPNCISWHDETRFYDRAKAIVLLTSEFNQKKYLENPQDRWASYFRTLGSKGVSVRVVHQPMDFSLFPRVKYQYGVHGCLYIGNDHHMKGVSDAKELAHQAGVPLHLFGIEGRSLHHLDVHSVSQLPGYADFFLQPGRWEAQCVSILESAARGFIPLVTPETGYPYEHPYLLRWGDMQYNLQQLRGALSLTPQERRVLADKLYFQFIQDENHNDWQKLTSVIINEVHKIYCS